MDAPPAYSAPAPEKAMLHLWESETCLWNPLTFEAQMVPQPETQAGRQFERTAFVDSTIGNGQAANGQAKLIVKNLDTTDSCEGTVAGHSPAMQYFNAGSVCARARFTSARLSGVCQVRQSHKHAAPDQLACPMGGVLLAESVMLTACMLQ